MPVTRYACRVRAEYIEGSTVRYTWPCGHTQHETLMIGPKGRGSKPFRKPMAPDMVRKLVNYWNGTGGVNSPACPTCSRNAKRQREGRDMPLTEKQRRAAVKRAAERTLRDVAPVLVADDAIAKASKHPKTCRCAKCEKARDDRNVELARVDQPRETR